MDDMNFYVDSNHFFDVQHNSKTLIGTLSIYLFTWQRVMCCILFLHVDGKSSMEKRKDNELVIFHSGTNISHP